MSVFRAWRAADFVLADVSARGRTTSFLVVALALSSLGQVTLANDWTQFRGTHSNGVASSDCPEMWSQTENVRWKVALPGEGWSCPVVWDDQVIVTAAVPVDLTGIAESYRPEPYEGGGGRQRSDLTQGDYHWQVICLDASSGQVRWRTTAKTGKPPIPRHSSNTFATETPITDGKRIYAYFGMTGLFCYDMDGKLVWQKDLGTYEMRAGWGTSSSPVLFDGKLFLQIDNEQQSFMVALRADTGDEIWRVERPERSQYSSPIIWKNSQRSELIAGGMFCRSYDPATGNLLWELDMQKGRSSATPLAIGDTLFVGTEFRDRGGADDGGGFLFAVKPGGKGDISPRDGSGNPFVKWQLARSGIEMASPVYCEGHIYLLERGRGIVCCVNADSGEVAYRKRIPSSRVFWSSPWTSNGKVFCLDDMGSTHVLAGGPEFRVLGNNELEEQSWSSPAVAKNTLFLRTAEHLYCISEGGD